MGNYYNPPDNLPRVGRKLSGHIYDDLMKELAEDEVLVGLFDRMIFKNAPHLFSEKEFHEFVDQPNLIKLGFFAVKKNTPGFDRLIE